MSQADDGGEKRLSAVERSQILSRALAEAARRSRFSSRTRRRMTAGGGFAARRGELLVRLVMVAGFVFIVALPSLYALVYYGLIASDQYVAEAKFTVRGGESPRIDGIGTLTGIPSVTIVQDTQIVMNYIESRAIVDKLEKQVDLRGLYSLEEVDWWSRFKRTKSIEKFVSYWQSMSGVSITMPAGIVTVTVRAFRPEDALRITEAVMSLSETLVNDINDRMRRDAISSSEQEFTRAMQKLDTMRKRLEAGRNDEGIVDVGQTMMALNSLMTSVLGERLKLQQEYDTQSKYVGGSAPQMRALKSRIAAADEQVDQLRAKLTSQKGESGQRPLSESFTRFSELDLEYQIAEKQYASAAATLELARADSERKMVYLTTFVRPSLPQEPRYPRRGLYPLYVVIVTTVAWGLLCGGVTAVRMYMA